MNFNTQTGRWIILLGLAAIWGSSFILMKRGLEAYSSSQVASLRIFIAFLFLIPFAAGNLKLAVSKKWKYLLAAGVFGNCIPAYLFTHAQTGLASSLTGMLNSLTPLFTLILGVFLFQAKIRWFNALGVIIGLSGAFGLILTNDGMSLSGSFEYAIYIIIATFMYALSVNIIKKHLNDVNSVHISAISFMFIGPITGIYLFSTDFTVVLATHPKAYSSLAYVTVLALVGTAVSLMVFNMLIKMTSAIFASSVTYLIPVVAMMWGVLDGEIITLLHLLWVIIILLGVYLVNKKKNEQNIHTKKESSGINLI